MKSIIVSLLLVLSVSANALNALTAIEKGSHRLETLFKKALVDKSFSTDTSYVTIQANDQGYVMTWYSPSNDEKRPNSITMVMGNDGKVVNQSIDFVAVSSQSPLFAKTDVATLFDLGTEAVVDHLSESPELSLVAETVTAVQMISEGNQVVLQMKLADGRIYKVILDQEGQFISRGF